VTRRERGRPLRFVDGRRRQRSVRPSAASWAGFSPGSTSRRSSRASAALWAVSFDRSRRVRRRRSASGFCDFSTRRERCSSRLVRLRR
jgi:hypothetical protein